LKPRGRHPGISATISNSVSVAAVA